MSAISDEVSRWIAREMADVTEGGSVTRIELHHTIEGEGSERLRVYRNLSDMTAESLSDDVWSIAEKDSATRANEMPQRYVLMSYRDDPDEGEADQPEAMHAFVLKGSILSSMLGSSTDPPTPAGRQAQDMRHSEALHRLMMTFAEGTAGRLARELDRASSRAERAEANGIKVMELYQDLLDKKEERDLRRAEQQASSKRMDELMGVVLSLGTLMAAKFLGAVPGSPGAPGAPPTPPALSGNPRSAALGRLLTGLSSEEAMGIFGALHAANKLIVQELHKSYQEFPPGSNSFVDSGRDLAIARFLRGLDKEELTGIMSVLSAANVETFKEIYASYYASYEEEQREKPAPLRDDPN